MRNLWVLAALLAQADSPGEWQPLATATNPAKRYENAYVRVGEKFYLVGGRYDRPAQAFNPEDGTWTMGARPPFQIHHFQAVEIDGLVYAAGAFTDNYPKEKGIENVYLYDPKADEWRKGPEIPAERRRGAAGAAVYKGKIYVAGGIVGGHGPHAKCQAWLDEFDPATGKWTPLADAPRARDHFPLAVVGDRLYALGGRDSGGTWKFFSQTIKEVDAYDFSTGRWSTLPAGLPTGRAAPAAAVLGNEILVMGGESDQPKAHADTEALDVAKNTWRALAPMKQGRHGTQAIVWKDRVYIAAGSKTRGESEIDTQEVFSPAK